MAGGLLSCPVVFFLQESSLAEIFLGLAISTLVILTISASYCLNFKLSTDSGGEISSAHFSFGKAHGFFCGWMVILVYISIVALNVSALPTVLRQISPELFTWGYLYKVQGWNIYLSDLILCSFTILFFAYTNTRVAKRVGRLQNVVTTLLLVVVIILTLSIFREESQGLGQQLIAPVGSYKNILTIFAIAPWAYIGFNIIPQIKMDASISSRKAYLLMVLSVLCGTMVYLSLTLVTFVGTSNFSEGLEQPWITGWAAEQLLGKAGLYLIFAGIITAVLAGINAFLYGSARLLHTMGNLHLLPHWFAEVRGTSSC